jgi:hypothetical protein
MRKGASTTVCFVLQFIAFCIACLLAARLKAAHFQERDQPSVRSHQPRDIGCGVSVNLHLDGHFKDRTADAEISADVPQIYEAADASGDFGWVADHQ